MSADCRCECTLCFDSSLFPCMQLLKLACAHLVTTPFYLITDADTLYLNPFSAGAPEAGQKCR